LTSYEKSPSGSYSKIPNKSLKIPLILLRVFIIHLDSILEAFENAKAGEPISYSLHLGGLLYLRIDKNIRCVDWRKHYIPKGLSHTLENLKPGMPGVGMKFIEFDAFISILEQLRELSHVDEILACSESEGHKSATTLENCKICNPMKLFS